MVDDSEINRGLIVNMFHEQYECVEAENGQIALGMLEEYGSKIAMVLLDIVMPVLDGY